MKKIDIKLRRTKSIGLFHDSRSDAILEAEVINLLIKTINVLIDEVEKLKLNNTAK
jgi:hypothetical protein